MRFDPGCQGAYVHMYIAAQQVLRSLRIDTASLSCSVQAPSAPSGETIRRDTLFSSAYHSRDYLCLWRLRSIETQSPPLSSLVPGDTTKV
jgi:hypothetical protein